MYQFTNTQTGKVHQYKTLNAACRAKDRIDTQYGGCVTTYPRRVVSEGGAA